MSYFTETEDYHEVKHSRLYWYIKKIRRALAIILLPLLGPFGTQPNGFQSFLIEIVSLLESGEPTMAFLAKHFPDRYYREIQKEYHMTDEQRDSMRMVELEKLNDKPIYPGRGRGTLPDKTWINRYCTVCGSPMMTHGEAKIGRYRTDARGEVSTARQGARCIKWRIWNMGVHDTGEITYNFWLAARGGVWMGVKLDYITWYQWPGCGTPKGKL